MDELKPCPCCGCGKVVIEQYKRDGLRIICKRCALKREQRVVSQTIEWLEGAMIEGWNARADGWISVEDKLPESCSEVYIWPRPDFGLDCHSGYYYKHNNEWKAQSMQCFGVEDHKVNVTHWMPLPAPPKAEK